MGFVVFIVCCHFISLYYLPREGPLLLLQAVQKALSRLIFSFCKDNHFFWESVLFLLFFLFFSLPWLLHSVPRLSHSLPRLSHSVPRLSHSLPWFCCHIPLLNVCPTHPTCRGRSFKKLPGVLKLLPLQGALLIALYPGRCPGLWASAPSGRAAFVFCKKKAFTFWAFLSQRVHRFTPFVTFWWIPVKGGFTPWIPSVYRASGADVKGEPSFLTFARIREKK